MKVLLNTSAMVPDVPAKDGDMDRMLVKIVVKSTANRYAVWHRLGRIPRKAYVVHSVGGFVAAKVSLDSSGREQSDAEKTTLEFSATGTAVICFE